MNTESGIQTKHVRIAKMSGVNGKDRSVKFTKKAMITGAALVCVMGLFMLFPNLSGEAAPQTYREEGGVQLVGSVMAGGRYPAITVRAGLPVKWTIDAPPDAVNGCNSRLFIGEYGLEQVLTPGSNLIEFTPERTGKFRYSCWMGMIRSTITVVDPDTDMGALTAKAALTGPEPAAYVIPAGEVVLGKKQGRIQMAALRITDEAIEPALVILQRGLNANLVIENAALDSGKDVLLFPSYKMKAFDAGGGFAITVKPEGDFQFSTGDNALFAYVKVVDDLDDIDLGAIQQEVSAYRPLVYPESHFR
ncbi:MAG: hypothetical protein LBR23_00010 [Spirochaetaceae bacterium]|nr:hypothetical protein [Spirochaetaceae bacterium]